jgi:hypothetical protein
VREKYCWLVAGGWFVLREKYCWLVADKPNEQGVEKVYYIALNYSKKIKCMYECKKLICST